MNVWSLRPLRKLAAAVKIPGDKSISHRAVMLASLANGKTKINGFLNAEDTLATVRAFRQMGVSIMHEKEQIIINGVGLHGLKKPAAPLNLGNSGTAVRLLAGILAAQNFDTELRGDDSLSERPMLRIIEPLQKMGAEIRSRDGKLPIFICGGKSLSAINYAPPVASAQVKSSILLAALYAGGTSCIKECAPTRDHTERMLQNLGAEIFLEDGKICISPPAELRPSDIQIPGDISSAAFFIVGASIAKTADIILRTVNVNPRRAGIIEILKRMGADLNLQNQRSAGGEPVADIHIRAAKLRGIRIPESLVPAAIDEFPAIFIAAAAADGETILSGAQELRVKESDRILTMAAGLKILGIRHKVFADGIRIIGGAFQKPKCALDARLDHRVAMAFAIASAACPYSFKIENTDNVKTSFPNFVALARRLGFDIRVND